jgi:BolA family transcriptional regulator, general stress-responsive regulator
MLKREELIANMRQRLNDACDPESLTIIDDSAQHAGHNPPAGAGHFTVKIVSEVFRDKSLVKRHQIVYQALGDYVGKEIHALSIKAKTPDEI